MPSWRALRALGGNRRATTAHWQAGVRVNRAIGYLESPPPGSGCGHGVQVGRWLGAVILAGTALSLRVAVQRGGDKPALQTHTGWTGLEGVSGGRRSEEGEAQRKALVSDEKGNQSSSAYPFSRFLTPEHPKACTATLGQGFRTQAWVKRELPAPFITVTLARQAQGDGPSLVLITSDDG